MDSEISNEDPSAENNANPPTTTPTTTPTTAEEEEPSSPTESSTDENTVEPGQPSETGSDANNERENSQSVPISTRSMADFHQPSGDVPVETHVVESSPASTSVDYVPTIPHTVDFPIDTSSAFQTPVLLNPQPPGSETSSPGMDLPMSTTGESGEKVPPQGSKPKSSLNDAEKILSADEIEQKDSREKPNIVPVQNLGMYESEVLTKCTICGETVTTEVTRRASNMAWFTCVILAVCLPLGCCLLPFAFDSCYRKSHYCPNCKTLLADCKVDP